MCSSDLSSLVTSDDIVNASESAGTVTVTGVVGGEYVAGDTVTLTVGGVTIGAGQVGADGKFAIAVKGTSLANAGTPTITATINTVDAAGNAGSATSTDSYTVDTTAPAPTVSLTLDSGTAGDRLTKDGSLAAHFEHTIVVTDGPAEILTAVQAR